MGLEPTRHCCHRHLKPARLPIPPLLHISYKCASSRLARYIVSGLGRNVNPYFMVLLFYGLLTQ